MSEPTKCAHELCTCTCPPGEKYCCQLCEDSSDTMTLSCDCRHTECGGEM
ncbi:hypothetical protein SAMN05421819_0840 [Bryocella elongata]|uniref:Metallothionein n=1 Tax=Bryocella elongata TaxID=863522 RepID=A0A1H5U2E7_9BACT|nr:hypothetical protein SAMN05421819_0840 [Bryocella elongata]